MKFVDDDDGRRGQGISLSPRCPRTTRARGATAPAAPVAPAPLQGGTPYSSSNFVTRDKCIISLVSTVYHYKILNRKPSSVSESALKLTYSNIEFQQTADFQSRGMWSADLRTHGFMNTDFRTRWNNGPADLQCITEANTINESPINTNRID